MGKGVALSLISSLLFGVLYYFPVLLEPLYGEVIFGWRIVMTVIALLILITSLGCWGQVRDFFSRVKHQRSLLIGLPLSGALIAVQMWLFMWSPLHGRGLSTSLGYFLLPLILVLTGRLLYSEKLSLFQIWAVAFAVVGVMCEIIISSAFSWDTALVAFGYPLYFINRRHFQIQGLVGLFSDMLFSLPYAIFFICYEPQFLSVLGHSEHLMVLVFLLGAITAVALFSYLTASRLLPLGLLGLLGYVEPFLLFIVALLFLGETLSLHQLLAYGPIWFSILILVVEGLYRTRKLLRRKNTVLSGM